jgi:type IV pilus assembly protein PilV
MQLIPRNDSRSAVCAFAGGFTLIEVLVALIITAIGLLGIAKIQALAYANTSSASARGLVAIQAAGLASAMHANRAYWAVGAAPASFTITGTVISDGTLNTTATGVNDCNVGGTLPAPCNPAQLAAYDLHTWANGLNALLLNSSPVTTINCPTGTTPINCVVTVTWSEKSVNLNSQSSANTTATTFAPTYILYVEP